MRMVKSFTCKVMNMTTHSGGESACDEASAQCSCSAATLRLRHFITARFIRHNGFRSALSVFGYRLAVFSYLFACVFFASDSLAASYRLAAAGVQGSAEYRMAEAVCASLGLEQKEISCQAIPAADARASLHMLSAGEADFALTLSPYIGEELAKAGGNKDLRTIAGLYDLHLMVGVSQKKKASTLDDLLAARMRLDMPGTISREAADALFDAMVITYSRFSAVVEAPDTKLDSLLCDTEIDAITALAHQRSALMSAFINNCGGRLLSIPEDIRGEFRLDHPGYRSAGLPSGTFVRLRYPVETLSAQMVLAGKAGSDENAVLALAATIAHQGQALRRMSPMVEPDSWKNTPLFTQLPLHPAAALIYKAK